LPDRQLDVESQLGYAHLMLTTSTAALDGPHADLPSMRHPVAHA